MADRDQLVRDLLPSPTRESAPLPTPPPPPPPLSRPRRTRPITTDDLQNRTCWICADSEDDDAAGTTTPTAAGAGAGAGAATSGRESSSRGRGSGAAAAARRRFVHPCKCTLVAHQSCLLHWIAQSRQNRPGEPVKCPQCQEKYVIVEDRPWLLSVLDWADWQVGKAVSINVWVLLSTTTLLGATAYGCVALRLVLGKEAAARTLRAPWPLRYYIQIPLIPFALIASKLHFLRLFDPLTPWLIAFLPSFAHLPLPILGFQYRGIGAQRRLSNRTSFESGAFGRTGGGGAGASTMSAPPMRVWPPNPGPTAMLIPFVRFAYLYLRMHISRRVLRPLLNPRGSGSNSSRERRRTGTNTPRPSGNGAAVAAAGNVQPAQPPSRTQRVVVLGAEGMDAQLLDADPPPGTAAVVETDREATPEDDELFDGDGSDDTDDDNDMFGEDADGFNPRRNQGRRRGGGGGGGMIHQQTVYITRQSVGRLVLNALTLPFAAAGMGSLLASVTRLTGKDSWPRRFLGLNFELLEGYDKGAGGGWRSPVGAMQDLFSPSRTSSSSAEPGLGTPLSSIFYGSNSGGGASGSGTSSATSQAFQRAASAPVPHVSSSSSSSASGAVQANSNTWLAHVALGGGGPSIYDDLLDAPWFRNAIGGLLVIALQDACRITYRYLKLKQRGRMSVRDLPFEDHLADSLDIRPGR